MQTLAPQLVEGWVDNITWATPLAGADTKTYKRAGTMRSHCSGGQAPLGHSDIHLPFVLP